MLPMYFESCLFSSLWRLGYDGSLQEYSRDSVGDLNFRHWSTIELLLSAYDQDPRYENDNRPNPLSRSVEADA